VPDVFCPECALRGALAAGNQAGEGTLLRWFRQLTARKHNDKRSPASAQSDWRHSADMPAATPTPGQVIGDYEILDRIGGNMGLVYKARHILLDKVVVLKLVPAEWIADSARLARFQREMRAMGQLEHPNLVTAADARSVGDWHLVAMELIDGWDLQQLVRLRGPLPVNAACEVARQAAQGLQYAHEHGLIHRDIKPSNLMLTRAGIIKVIDMGLALIRDDSTAQLTQSGFVLGTMSYCAPEQFRDASHVDIRADIYSLGCTLYHLLTGKAPYWQKKTFPEIVEAHLHDPFPSLREARPDAPAELEALLARMTAKDRDARFATPREVVEALEPSVQGADLVRLVPATAPQNPVRRTATSKLRSSPERQRATTREERPKARWLRVAALLALLGTIAGVAFLSTNRPTHNSAAAATNAVASTPHSVVPASDLVVVLMDTTAPHGIYDEDNQRTGRSNAKELYELLQREIKDIPPENIDEQSVGLNWDRRNRVRLQRPHLVVIHRSIFYHPVAAALNFPYPDRNPPMTDEEFREFEQRYKILGDDKLREFLGDIGSSEPRTRFLVYSRGTDTNWLSPEFQVKWTKEVEDQYPALKGRVKTMLIDREMIDGKMTAPSFRNPKTREDFLKRVREILGIRAKHD
jgi:serine/threonine protein kinase